MTHEVFYALHLTYEEYGDYTIEIIELISFYFFHPFTLAYVIS